MCVDSILFCVIHVANCKLPKHLDEIRLLLHDKKLDVLALNETRLDSSISDDLVSIEGYDILRSDRNRNGGGVCIYVRCYINYKNRPDLIPKDLEAISLEIKQVKSKSFIISSVYRPPNTTVEIFSKIEKQIQLVDNENKEFYLLGDLNCNLLDSNLSNVKMLQEIMQLYQLTQIIDVPIRVTKSTKSILDVCITSSPDKIFQSGVVHLGISDHSLIYATRKLNSVRKGDTQNLVEFRNFRKFNVESFLSDLYLLPWVELDSKQHVDEMWTCWKTLFLEVLDKHAPKRSVKIRKNGNVPWFNKNVKNKLFQRDHFKRVAIKTNNENDWKLYRSSRNAANIALQKAKREYYTTKFLNSKTNPKHAWKTVNEILGRSRRQNIINEINLPEKTVTSTKELVNVFNDYFTDIGPKLAEKIEYEHNCSFQDFIPQHEPVEKFIFQPVNVATVYRLMTKLTTSKATGIDEISAKVLKAATPAVLLQCL